MTGSGVFARHHSFQVVLEGYLLCSMSRCFPFPPPGYEKKTKLDELDSFAKKEKHKEKKDKKEKKEKKEKKDKDRKDKERKDKDRDKDRSKDKHKKRDHSDRKKDKENNIVGKNAARDRNFDERSLNESVIDVREKNFEENKFGEREKSISEKSFERDRLKFKAGDEKLGERDTLQEKPEGNLCAGEKESLKNKGKDDSKNDTREKHKIQNNDEKKIVSKEKNSEKERGEKKDKVEKKYRENSRVKIKKDGDRDKNKEKDRERDKVKSKDRVKEKDLEKDRGKGKEGQETQLDNDRNRNNIKVGHIEKQRSKHSLVDMAHDKNNIQTAILNDTSVRKRKEMDSNGDIHENDERPSKLSRTVLNGEQKKENGRIVSEFRPPTVPTPLDSNNRISDKIVTKQLIDDRASETSSQAKPQENGKTNDQSLSVSGRPLHNNKSEADDKEPYIDNYDAWDDPWLSVSYPVSQPWSDIDDQSWLFQRNNSEKKPKAEMQVDKPVTQVWSEAVHIESIDTYALPFVIPY